MSDELYNNPPILKALELQCTWSAWIPVWSPRTRPPEIGSCRQHQPRSDSCTQPNNAPAPTAAAAAFVNYCNYYCCNQSPTRCSPDCLPGCRKNSQGK
jgi:hypothetical protein